MQPGNARFRLADLVAALSLGVDLGFGQPMEHALRQCIIALRIADRLGLDELERRAVYYTALLIVVGCHADAHEQAKWFSDDIAFKSRKYEHDSRSLAGAVSMVGQVGAGLPPLHRFRLGIDLIREGRHDVVGMIANHAALAQSLTAELGLDESVQHAVGAAYERWDGRGWPGNLRGNGIPIAARIAQLSEYVEVEHRVGGVDEVIRLVRERSGGQFDPELCQLLQRDATEMLADLDATTTWSRVIDAEPSLQVTLDSQAGDAALAGVGRFVDLKSPYFLGHSGAVADLAWSAAGRLGLPADEREVVRRAGWILGLGRLGISNAILDKEGPLGGGEWERMRMQPYLTERMLRQSDWLAPLGVLAAQVRERLDGSGYPRGVNAASLSLSARLLATADVYQALREPRPQRRALTADAAAGRLRSEGRLGRLDLTTVDAVLSVAGATVGRRADRPDGLTAREVEVMRLAAAGLKTSEIARRLVISPKTARNHVEHIYAKIGVSNRAAASLYAVREGLLPVDTYPTSANEALAP
jgi:HD-GYP domain-containing protein (c-di-GMP phosphodiesterase class II)